MSKKRSFILMLGVNALFCFLLIVFSANTIMAVPAQHKKTDTNMAVGIQPELVSVNKINAICNGLDSVERRLEKVLSRYDETAPVSKGMAGKLVAMANQLIVKEKQLTKVLDTLSERKLPNTTNLEEAFQNLNHYAVRIAGLTQLLSQIVLDSEILDALGQLEVAAGYIAHLPQIHFQRFYDKVIPIRFVQVYGCLPFLQGRYDRNFCQPHLYWDSIDASVDSLNAALHGIGLHFWIKSVERYYMYHFANATTPTGTIVEYADAISDIGKVFPIPELPNPPYNRQSNHWINYMSTIYSEPTELLVWVFGPDSLVSREISHHSVSSLPSTGRFVIISSDNINYPNRPYGEPDLSPYHLTHELGHFFGLGHAWEDPTTYYLGTNPYTQERIGWADLWDLIYCPSELGFPTVFNSRQAAEEADCNFQTIEKEDPANCHIGNKFGGDDSIMRCTIQGADYHSGHPFLKGLSFFTGMPENPPVNKYDATYSFEWGLNVMGYYSRYNAHLWVPGRYSASQLEIIKGHTLHNVYITDTAGFYAPYELPLSLRSWLGR